VELQLPRERESQFRFHGGKFGWLEILDVPPILRDAMFFQPLTQSFHKEIIVKILTPERRERHSRLPETAIEIQYSNQSGPLPRPICDGENWTAMLIQARK
jgi:hypothetical protein